MNVENIKKVRDLIASLPPERFNMRRLASRSRGRELRDVRRIQHSCGTAACIAGWTNAIFCPENKNADTREASIALGLYYIDHMLFMPFGYFDGPVSKATPAQAVAVLDRLLETGGVDWDWAMSNPATLPNN